MAETRDIGSAGYAARVELHPLPSLTLTDEQFLKGAENEGKLVTIAGSLRIPRGGTDRLPVVILMHGSGGIGSYVEFWQRELNALGVSTFAIDGFTGRGLSNVNANQSLLARTNLIVDIYRSLGVLAKHPRVDPQRVAIMGFSRGGQAALYASVKRFDHLWNKSSIFPALYLPFYPDCAITFKADTDVADRPIRIFGGSSDDYNPPASCAAYVERLKAAGRNVEITVYPNAQHVFDIPFGPETPVTVEGGQTVRNCKISEDANGGLINSSNGAHFTYADPCVERGPHYAPNAAARNFALQAVREILTRTFDLK
ncbi:dienelactone hydrolase family protein [Methylobacterium sp. NEAU K]|uniref:dienelactone hydrolase family protein n=1 Tax=Methylobacterium sp. NEAU K TaxID=3064946 RepID=UPI002736E5A8|nr:dienelactone hydrolase family protein [Methylobacterium sp. NEAU K]MDP4006368.1 dienelactone hydrolase family protein [Methylobacterium sp. NEAU K]